QRELAAAWINRARTDRHRARAVNPEREFFLSDIIGVIGRGHDQRVLTARIGTRSEREFAACRARPRRTRRCRSRHFTPVHADLDRLYPRAGGRTFPI